MSGSTKMWQGIISGLLRRHSPETVKFRPRAMKFEIHSHVGAGPIHFGMPRDQVRSLISVPFSSRIRASQMRTSESELPYDFFESLGVFVNYKPPGRVEALEFAAPAEAIFDGCNLLSLSFSAALALLKSHDDAITAKAAGCTSYKFGLGVYATFARDYPNDPVEAVIVFEREYYDCDR